MPNRNVFLFVNVAIAKFDRPEWIRADSNLNADRRGTICNEFSLYPIGGRLADELWNLSQHLKNQDACLWLVSKLSCAEVADGIKKYRGWFARPSILKHSLEQGSKDFVKQLLTDIDVIILQVPGDPKYHIFTNPEVTIDWNTLD